MGAIIAPIFCALKLGIFYMQVNCFVPDMFCEPCGSWLGYENHDNNMSQPIGELVSSLLTMVHFPPTRISQGFFTFPRGGALFPRRL
jgi:hypothetical protein